MNDPLFISSKPIILNSADVPHVLAHPDRRDIALEAGRMAYRAGLPHHENPFLDHHSIYWSIGWIEEQTARNHALKIVIG